MRPQSPPDTLGLVLFDTGGAHLVVGTAGLYLGDTVQYPGKQIALAHTDRVLMGYAQLVLVWSLRPSG